MEQKEENKKAKVIIEIDKDVIKSVLVLAGIKLPADKAEAFYREVENAVIDDTAAEAIPDYDQLKIAFAMVAIGIAAKNLGL